MWFNINDYYPTLTLCDLCIVWWSCEVQPLKYWYLNTDQVSQCIAQCIFLMYSNSTKMCYMLHFISKSLKTWTISFHYYCSILLIKYWWCPTWIMYLYWTIILLLFQTKQLEDSVVYLSWWNNKLHDLPSLSLHSPQITSDGHMTGVGGVFSPYRMSIRRHCKKCDLKFQKYYQR